MLSLMQVLLGITDTELDIFDTFEDFEYERSVVEVSEMVGIFNYSYLPPVTNNEVPQFPASQLCSWLSLKS